MQHDDIEQTTGNRAQNADGYKLVYKNDIIVNIILCWMGAIGRSDYDGVTSPAYDVYKPHNDIDCNFFHYYFRTTGFNGDCYRYGRGIMAMRWRTYSDQFRAIKVLLPPQTIQQKIATYLDKKCAAIDSAVEKEQLLIEELKNYKQSVITQTVTKGIRPNRKMKQSGIEWIGEIPEEWEIGKIKHIADIYGRIGFRGYTDADLVSEGEGPITLSPSNMKDTGMNYQKCSYLTWNKYEESPEIQIKNEDILFVKTGSTYGKSTIVENLPMEATINPQLIVFKNIRINNRLFFYLLQTPIIRRQIECVVSGGTIPTMSQEKIKNFQLIVFSPSEQQEIVDYLAIKCSSIDSTIRQKTTLIEKLKEYKKSLIYECVTGKREVKE